MKAIFVPWFLLGAVSSVLAQPVGTLTADAAVPGKAPTMSCERLASIHLPGMKTTHATATPPGALQRSIALTSHCVATATLKPSHGANFKMELWMPIGDWNGKLMMIGNDGWGDSIASAEMVEGVRRGHAVVATDSGHAGPRSTSLLHSEPLMDFAYRAVHETNVKAKALAAAYYGATPLEEWVERGWAPESVLANHIPPPNATPAQPPPGAVVFEPPFGIRLMCAYPRIARLQSGLCEGPVDWICQSGPRGSKVDQVN